MVDDIVLGYLTRKTTTRSPMEAVDLLFDYNLMVIMPEFFRATREYELGLEFAENVIEIIERMREVKPDYEYRARLQQTLLLKLDMMDRMNDIKGYLILFDELRTSEDPRYISPYPRKWVDKDWEPYIAYTDGEDIYMRFVYRIEWRQRVMLRKWKRFLAGKQMGNQLRHQKDRLSDEEILRRVDEFFNRYQYSFLSGVMT